MLKLIIEDDEGHTTVVPLVKDEITIGRKDGNTIRLTERNVSRHHARMLRSNGTVFVEDLDSYNGVKVNGGKISARTTIREGDLVEIGDYHLAIQQVEDTASPPQPPAAGGQPPPPPAKTQQAPAPTTGDGGTAVMRVPLEEKKVPEPGRARPIAEAQAAMLLITTTDLAGQVFPLSKTEITIGRTEENDITLPHRSVSSRHAKIVHDGGIYRVIDLDSANGVLVNGEEYARVDVRKGDVIELGHVKLRYLAPGEDANDVLAQVQATVDPGMDTPAPVVPVLTARPMVDATVQESGASKGGSGKMIGLILGALVVLGAGAYALVHFTSEGTSTQADAGGSALGPGKELPGDPPKDPEKPIDDPVKLQPGSEAAEYFKQGLERMKTNDWELAEQAMRSCTKMDSAHKGCQEMLERILKEKEASTLLKQAKVAIEGKDWDEALDLLNQIPGASKAFREAGALKPEVVKQYRGNHLNKADRLEKSGKLKEALKEYDAVLVIDEDNFLAKNNKEKLLKRLAAATKKPPRVATVKRPPTTTRKDPPASGSKKRKSSELRKEGIDAYKKNQFSKAISLYQKALKSNTRDYELYRLIGSAHARMGNRKKAYQAYKKYVQFCPKCMYTPAIRKILKDYEELQQ